MTTETTATESTIPAAPTEDFSKFIAVAPILARALRDYPEKVAAERLALAKAELALASAKAASASNLARLDVYTGLITAAREAGALTYTEFSTVTTRLQAEFGSGLVSDCELAVEQARDRLWFALARVAKKQGVTPAA
ncbi:MAG: hypothetical protein ACREB3_01640 [Burkholderiales bacterium]